MVFAFLIASMCFKLLKQFQNYLETKNYVRLHSVPSTKVASSDIRDNFDETILESGLTINNKNVQYSPFEEKNNVVKGGYTIAAKGKYLLFVKYLDKLQKNNTLYKINLISLKVRSLDEIDIKLNIESLYEIK